jgi:hypothetical protein
MKDPANRGMTQLPLSAASLRQSSGQFRQFMADLQTALNEVALQSNPLPPVTSAPILLPPYKIEHAAEEVLSEPSDSLGTEGMTSAVISAAVSSPSEAAEQAAEYPKSLTH